MAYSRNVVPRMFTCSCHAHAVCEVFTRGGESLGYFCHDCAERKINECNKIEYPAVARDHAKARWPRHA